MGFMVYLCPLHEEENGVSFFSMVYQLLIGPLEILYEFIYNACYAALWNDGLCIILLSLVMNFLLLPLYKRADAIQDAERAQEKNMADIVAHIKKTFSGDERFMMLQTYYRQNHYKPFYVLKGFLPLVLEIPFFIAAYHFLSNYQPLAGTSFGPITDLGAPDQLLHIFGVTINLLPVLMTLINIVSSAIYTRGFPLKDKLQLYGMALLFLILLYDSPAGLVIYWTLNNLFSLVKNLLGRMKKGRGWLAVASAAAGAGLLIFGLTAAGEDDRLPSIFFGALLMIPVVVMLLKKGWTMLASRFFRNKAGKICEKDQPAPNTKQFVLGCILLAVLTGALIPSAVIESSPGEFIHAIHYYSPLRHILNASLLSFGLFVIWFGIFNAMFSMRGKRIFGAVIWVLCGINIVNYMFFGTNLGTLSAELYYDRVPIFSLGEKLLNLGVLAALAGLMILVWRKKRQIVLWVTVILVIAVSGMAGWNMISIQSVAGGKRDELQKAETQKAQIALSSDGKNVVVIMLDAYISSYLPYIMEENPELQRQFAGFVYYPNTVSFGKNTNMGTPAIYGGYEYTPEEINKRSDESLEEKQNEALRVMPVLFRDAGYQVTVCDPPYAGYSWIPDLSIFDGEDYSGIQAYHTEQGQFTTASDEVLDQIWQRNFFCYGLMKVLPLAVQPGVYENGYYLGELNVHTQFEKSFGVLKSLSSMTVVQEGSRNTFLSLSNSATHEPVMLSLPDYDRVVEDEDPLLDSGKSLVRTSRSDSLFRNPEGMDSIELVSAYVRKYYMIDTMALFRVGEWLDCLREQGVYDNTRIIIVSDHGRNLGMYKDLVIRMPEATIDVMSYNALLLVKDFGSEESGTDDRLMTCGDVPVLAMSDLIENPVNPYTGKAIESVNKEGTDLSIFASDLWSTDKNHGNTFQPGEWFYVHDDIFNPENWTYRGEW